MQPMRRAETGESRIFVPVSAHRFTLDDLLALLTKEHRLACKKLLKDFHREFQAAPGSTKNHQAWVGGYLDHLVETMNIGDILYDTLHARRPLPFEKRDALLVLFLHDLDKPFRIIPDGEGFRSRQPKGTYKSQVLHLLGQYGFLASMSEAQVNALLSVEGEKDDYSPSVRGMGPLAAFCHLCDVTSARIWFDHPKSGDSWE